MVVFAPPPLLLEDRGMAFSQVWYHAQFRTTSERSLDDFPHDLKSLDMLGRFNCVSSVLMSTMSILKQVRRIANRYAKLLAEADDYLVSSRDVKLLETGASRGAVDIKIGPYTIRALNVFSAHHALLRTVLLGRNLLEACLKPVVPTSLKFVMPLRILAGFDIGRHVISDLGFGSYDFSLFSARLPVIQMMLHAVNLLEDTFACPKSMVPNRILDMIQGSCLGKVYEAGWTPGKRQPHPRSKHGSEANPTGNIWGSTDSCYGTSLPVLFDACGRIETTSTATRSGPSAATPPAYPADDDDDDDDAAYYDAMSDAEAVDSVCMQSLATGADDCNKAPVLAPAAYLRDQNKMKVIDFGSACKEGLQGLSDTKQEQHSYRGLEKNKHENKEKSGAATWLVATAAPNHATGNRSLLTGFTTEVGLFVEAGDGERMPVLGRGSVVTDAVVLPDVVFVPGLAANLVSVSKLAELDYSVGFAHGACYIRGATDGKLIGKAQVGEDGLFELDFLKVPPAF